MSTPITLTTVEQLKSYVAKPGDESRLIIALAKVPSLDDPCDAMVLSEQDEALISSAVQAFQGDSLIIDYRATFIFSPQNLVNALQVISNYKGASLTIHFADDAEFYLTGYEGALCAAIAKFPNNSELSISFKQGDIDEISSIIIAQGIISTLRQRHENYHQYDCLLPYLTIRGLTGEANQAIKEQVSKNQLLYEKFKHQLSANPNQNNQAF